MIPQEVNQRLVEMVESVAAHLLPNGKRIGNSWCAGSTAGESGQSLRLCLTGGKAGVWSDFSSNDTGGDLLELWQQTRGITFVEALKEAKDFAGIVDDEPTFYAPRVKKKPVKKPSCTKPDDTLKSWFDGRGITEKTVSAFNIGQNGSTIVFPFLFDGKIELVKYRDVSQESNGKKKIWSNEDPEYHLFGWQAITENDRSVVICEGEIDAMTWYQQGFPSLSVPQGAGDGDKQAVWINNDYERLQRFEKIYVSMDMDKAGQSAIKPIIDRLGVERCHIVDLGEYKDANQAHCDGITLEGFIKAARTKDPDELGQLADHHDDIMREFEDSDIIGNRLPWQKTYQTIRLRPSEITVWAGINSHGKSLATSQVAVDLVSQGERVCIASMEMKPRKLGRKMYQQITNVDKPIQSVAQEALRFVSDKIWLFEAYGTAKADRILEVFSYARKRYGVTHFFVDSLAKCGYAEDDYNAQKSFVDRLMEFSGQHNVHVHLVVHIRKLQDEAKIPGKFDIKGTGAITDMVDNVGIIWRNKPKEEAMANGTGESGDHDMILNWVKQRETGEEPMCGLFFHANSCQFLSYQDDPPKEYIY